MIPAGSGLLTGLGVTQVRLVDGEREMMLLPRDGVVLQRLDLGYPATRELAEPRTADDGEHDTTSLHGGRSVAVDMLLIDVDADPVLDELRSFCRPADRPYLYVSAGGWESERRIRLRKDQQSAPVTAEFPPPVRQVQAQWKAPDGVLEAAEQTTTVISAEVHSSTGLEMTVASGLSVTVASGVAMTVGTSGSAVIVDNTGSMDAHWVARLYGPCTGPRFSLDSVGVSLAFPGLTIPAGEYVELDSRARTAHANGDATISRLNALDFASSTWWRLPAGANQVRYHPDSGASAATEAHLLWRECWL
jgi:hypothetical protein